MSLMIWLPLCKDGDYKNQGILGDLTISTTPTFVNSGKIGSKSMSGGSMYMTAEQTSKVLNNDSFSIAFWIYINLNTGTSKITTLFGNANMSPPNNRRFTLYHYDTCNKLHVTWCNYDSSSDIIGYVSGADLCPSYTWTHIALTYSKSSGKVLLYKNGTLYATVKTGVSLNNPTYAFQTTLMANDSSRYLQDYRVYSNCLTPEEVKEISKGLVAHYTLGSESVYEATTNIASSLTPVQNGGWDGMTITKKSNNCYHLKAAHTQSSWHTFVYTLPQDCDGLTITFSAYINNISTSNLNLDTSWLFIGQGNNGQYPTHGSATYTINQLKNNLLLKWTGTISNNSNRYLIIECWTNPISSGSTCFVEFDLSAILIEKKDHVTQYIDGTRSPGIVYDSSGYSRNLTITGNVSPADSVRYDKSLQGNGSLTTSALTFNNPFTISYWVYLPATGTTGSGNEISIGPFNLYKDHDGVDKHTFSVSKSDNSTTYLTLGVNMTAKWYHVAIVSNGSEVKIYKDGVVSTHSISTKNGLTTFNLLLNNNLKLSDVRVYSTALSADDISDLYKLGALIS